MRAVGVNETSAAEGRKTCPKTPGPPAFPKKNMCTEWFVVDY